jgi:hypothetical protein
MLRHDTSPLATAYAVGKRRRIVAPLSPARVERTWAG